MKITINNKKIFVVAMLLSLQGVRSSDIEQGVQQIAVAENNQDIQQQIYDLATAYVERSTEQEAVEKKFWEDVIKHPAAQALKKYYEEVLHCDDVFLDGIDKRILEDLEKTKKGIKNEIAWEQAQPRQVLSQQEIDEIKSELRKLELAYIQEKKMEAAEESMRQKVQDKKPTVNELLEQLINKCKEANVTEEFMLTLPKKAYVAIKNQQDWDNMLSSDSNKWEE